MADPEYRQKWNRKRRPGKRRRRVERGGDGYKKHWKFLHEVQDGRCAMCGSEVERGHVDHKIPTSKGGTSDLSNLQLLCESCNWSKGSKVGFLPVGEKQYRII